MTIKLTINFNTNIKNTIEMDETEFEQIKSQVKSNVEHLMAIAKNGCKKQYLFDYDCSHQVCPWYRDCNYEHTCLPYEAKLVLEENGFKVEKEKVEFKTQEQVVDYLAKEIAKLFIKLKINIHYSSVPAFMDYFNEEPCIDFGKLPKEKEDPHEYWERNGNNLLFEVWSELERQGYSKIPERKF